MDRRTARKRRSSNADVEGGGPDISDRIAELNREMMQLPLQERRSTWKEYYQRLGQLARGAGVVSSPREPARPNRAKLAVRRKSLFKRHGEL